MSDLYLDRVPQDQVGDRDASLGNIDYCSLMINLGFSDYPEELWDRIIHQFDHVRSNKCNIFPPAQKWVNSISAQDIRKVFVSEKARLRVMSKKDLALEADREYEEANGDQEMEAESMPTSAAKQKPTYGGTIKRKAPTGTPISAKKTKASDLQALSGVAEEAGETDTAERQTRREDESEPEDEAALANALEKTYRGTTFQRLWKWGRRAECLLHTPGRMSLKRRPNMAHTISALDNAALAHSELKQLLDAITAHPSWHEEYHDQEGWAVFQRTTTVEELGTLARNTRDEDEVDAGVVALAYVTAADGDDDGEEALEEGPAAKRVKRSEREQRQIHTSNFLEKYSPEGWVKIPTPATNFRCSLGATCRSTTAQHQRSSLRPPSFSKWQKKSESLAR
ncbi:hypothetical protein SCUP515_02244 [Seiridium cupressi]